MLALVCLKLKLIKLPLHMYSNKRLCNNTTRNEREHTREKDVISGVYNKLCGTKNLKSILNSKTRPLTNQGSVLSSGGSVRGGGAEGGGAEEDPAVR